MKLSKTLLTKALLTASAALLLSSSSVMAAKFKEVAGFQDAISTGDALASAAANPPIAKNCVLVLNKKSGAMGSGILLDGGQHVLTTAHNLVHAAAQDITVIHTRAFYMTGERQLSLAQDVAPLKSSKKFDVTKMYSFAEINQDLSGPQLFLEQDAQKTAALLKQNKTDNQDPAWALTKGQLRAAKIHEGFGTIFGPDLALLEMTAPATDVTPWLDNVPNDLSGLQWDEGLVLGHTHQAESCDGKSCQVFKGQKGNKKDKVMNRRLAVALPGIHLAPMPDHSKGKTPDAHIASSTFLGTDWEKAFTVPEGAPKHMGKPEYGMSGGITLGRNIQEDGAPGPWIPLGLFSTETVDTHGLSSLAQTQNPFGESFSDLVESEGLAKGWPHHQISDVLTPTVKRTVQATMAQEAGALTPISGVFGWRLEARSASSSLSDIFQNNPNQIAAALGQGGSPDSLLSQLMGGLGAASSSDDGPAEEDSLGGLMARLGSMDASELSALTQSMLDSSLD